MPNTKTMAKGRPANNRPPSKSVKRTKKLELPLFRNSLVITFRKFNLGKNRNSRKAKQLIINLNIKKYRQLSIAYVKKNKKTYANLNRQRLFFKPRYLLTATLLIVGIAGIVFSISNFTKPVRLDISPKAKAANTLPVSAGPVNSKSLNKSIPTHIRIDSVGISTNVVSVGLNQDKSIAMPNSVDIAAWYTGSPTPGELGPSVIAGHVDNYKGVGAFFMLKEVNKGDLIFIDRIDGSTAVFKVSDIKQVPQANFPTQEVYGKINYAGIRLITCGGAFNTVTHEYEDNIVVFGVLQ